jgi:hypothetical protein
MNGFDLKNRILKNDLPFMIIVISIHRLSVAASRWGKENKAKRYTVLNAADRGGVIRLTP